MPNLYQSKVGHLVIEVGLDRVRLQSAVQVIDLKQRSEKGSDGHVIGYAKEGSHGAVLFCCSRRSYRENAKCSPKRAREIRFVFVIA